MRYYRCPDCNKAGVTLRYRPGGEDHYACRYCEFYCFTMPGDETDARQMDRLRAVNRGVVL